jgi:hypothetical protein
MGTSRRGGGPRDRHDRDGRRVIAALLAAALVVGATTACGRAADERTSAPTRVSTASTAPTSTAPAASTTSTTAPPSFTVRRRVDAAHPLKVAFIGDSVAYSVVPTLQAVAQELQDQWHVPLAVHGGFTGPGFGLTADVAGHNDIGPTPPPESFAHWQDSVDRVVAEEDPDVVLVLLGIWDTIERSPFGVTMHPGMRAWRQWYEHLADDFVRRLTARGASVVWLLMPCVGRPDVTARLQQVNAVITRTRAVAPRRVAFVDLARVACDGGTPVYQAPSAWGPLTVREADGVHFRPLEATPVLRPFLAKRFVALLRETRAVPLGR